MRNNNRCKVIAEGCCNHKGDVDLALEMTRVAAKCGADFIKWQKRNPKASIKESVLQAPHPNASHAFGETYLQHRENLEFSFEEHKMLKECARENGIGYTVSVWDLDSAKEMIGLCDDFIKIPSAANYDIDLIYYLLENFRGQVHVSLGMLDRAQKEYLFNKLSRHDNRIVYYHTTTSYPCAFEHLFLKEIEVLSGRFGVAGFSGHHKGIAADMVAYAYGARWIERHFTLDRTFKGTDQAASLEPRGLELLVRDLKAVNLANHGKTILCADELNGIKKLRTPESEKFLENNP